MKNSNTEDFYTEFKQIISDNNFATMSDMLSGVGDIINKHQLSLDELQDIINKYPDDWDVNHLIKIDKCLKSNGIKDIKKFNAELKKLGYKITVY